MSVLQYVLKQEPGMAIHKINPKTMKQPSKSYSNGVLIPLGVADLFFSTGQLAQDIDGNVVSPGNASEQTRYIFDRLADILHDADMTFDDVVKAQIFLTDINDSPAVSVVRDKVFINSKPASTLVEVSKLVKPGCVVEIEVTAVKLK
jgi:enamine deaminase RidA (YjgF/YER057c/UK114 family)